MAVPVQSLPLAGQGLFKATQSEPWESLWEQNCHSQSFPAKSFSCQHRDPPELQAQHQPRANLTASPPPAFPWILWQGSLAPVGFGLILLHITKQSFPAASTISGGFQLRLSKSGEHGLYFYNLTFTCLWLREDQGDFHSDPKKHHFLINSSIFPTSA